MRFYSRSVELGSGISTSLFYDRDIIVGIQGVVDVLLALGRGYGNARLLGCSSFLGRLEREE